METIELTCIGCPLGCPLRVEKEGAEVLRVTGNTCPRGEAYSRREVTHPTRVVTSTVRVAGGALPVVSCKTAAEVPKDKIFDVVRALKEVQVPAPVTIGQVLAQDIAGTGGAVVATRNLPAQS